jgi:hypothetical protein
VTFGRSPSSQEAAALGLPSSNSEGASMHFAANSRARHTEPSRSDTLFGSCGRNGDDYERQAGLASEEEKRSVERQL